LVDVLRAVRGQRAHREFRLPGNAKFANRQHIERYAERGRHFERDRHAPARQGEHDDVASPRIDAEALRKHPACFAAISEWAFHERLPDGTIRPVCHVKRATALEHGTKRRCAVRRRLVCTRPGRHLQTQIRSLLGQTPAVTMAPRFLEKEVHVMSESACFKPCVIEPAAVGQPEGRALAVELWLSRPVDGIAGRAVRIDLRHGTRMDEAEKLRDLLHAVGTNIVVT
jgi:hypothetical protein